MKKIILFIIAILYAGIASAYDFSAVCESGQTLYYTITSSAEPYTLQVVSENSSSPYYTTYPTGELVIPNTVTYNGTAYNVTSIKYDAFYGCSGLTSVTIPNSITSIGTEAFYDCSGLASVTFGNSVTSIGRFAFYNCIGLTSVTVPNSVTSIEYSAFGGCSGLEEMTIPFVGSGATEASTSTVFGYIFGSSSYNGGTAVIQHYSSGANNNRTYYIPSGLRSVVVTGGNLLYGAFYGCSMLTSVTIPNSVTSIGNSAFRDCSGLISIIIPNSVRSIDVSAFNNCIGLTSLTFGNSVTSIGGSAFYNCSGLTSVSIPNTVTSIGGQAFGGCSGLEEMTIPFVGSSLSATEASSSTLFGNIFGTSSYNGGTAVTQYYNNSGSKTNYIPSGLRSVVVTGGNLLCGAFYGCSMLTSITIPDTITSIEEKAFYSCTGLTSVEIPNSVTSIGGSAFYNCRGLTSLTFGNSVTSIGESAFYNCSGLTSVSIPNSVTSIGNYAFSNCSGLVSVVFNARICTTMGSLDYPVFDSCTSLTTLNIGDSATNIPAYAFATCSLLTTVTIPNSVTSIGTSAFHSCNGLTSVEIPNSVTSIGSSAFYNCSGLTSVTIPNSVTSIGASTFHSCNGLTSVEIPNSITSIGSSAFYNCSGLTSVTIPNSVTSIGESAFGGCSSLVSVDFNAINCTTMGSSNKPVFKDCTAFTTLNIGTNATNIPNYAFLGCSGLTSVTIANSVTRIGKGAFSGCGSLVEMTIPFVGAGSSGESGSSVFGYIFGTSTYNGGTRISQNYGPINNAYSTVDFCIPSSLRTVTITKGNLPFGAFWGCSMLTSITIPDSITRIGDYAFRGCSGLTSITIPNSVTYIGEGAFLNCNRLVEMEIPFVGTTPHSTGNEAYFRYVFAYRTTQTPTVSYAYDIPETLQSVTIIGGNLMSNAFRGCTMINSISLGEGVEIVYSNALDETGWYNNQPTGLLYLDGWSLGYKEEEPTGDFVLREDTKKIAYYAFSDCDNLLSLDTRNVVSVGESAFANCDRLVQVNIGDSARSIGNGAFGGCFRMSSVNIGKSVETIGDNAFNGCVRLVSPALPETLTSIGTSAFNGCSRFEGMLTLPRNLTQIGDSAYSGCSGITAITAKPTNPPVISENTFAGISNEVPVYVPCGRVLNYYVTDYWENFPNIQEATPFEVSLSSNDNAMGVAVVAQQPTCSNHQCHIRANANYGYHFLKWNDGNESNPRILELDSDTAFMAIFVVNNSYISVQCNDSTMGSVSGSGLYSYNAPVEMRATPYTNYHFQRWHDGVTDNPRYLLATQDSTFTAVFLPNVSTVTLSNNNPEMGTVSGGGVYYYQNQISISATANYGYHFTSWHDGNTANPRMITVTQDTAFTANFAVNIYAVSATSNNNTMGSVSGGGNYNYQSLVALTATPAYGYHFEQWNDGLSNNPRTINVIQDTMFMAQFAANTYSITVQANDPRMGSAYGTGNFSYNTTTTLSATATYGYHFVQWSDGNTENPRTVPVTQNAIYTAIFEINTYAISVGSSNPAIGSAAGGGTYSYNTIVNISATPNYGYHFVQWSDGNTENPRTITVIQNATYTAQFSINSYAVSVSPNNSSRGTVSGSGSYTYNTVATISASAFYGYHFVQWSDGNTENPRSLVVMQDENYTAQFDANNYLLTANSTDVTLGNVTGGGTYEYNSLVAITANAIEHYHFVQWNDSITDNPRTIVLTRDTTFTASFAIDKHSVATTSNNPTMGEATGSGEFNYNSATYISAEAFTGYHFVQWSDGVTANPRRIIVTQDTIFTAEFVVNGYTATIQSNDETMGTVTGSGFYDYRTTLNLSATAFYGYHFARWNDGNTDNPRTLVITQDTALTAIFEISSFTITVEAENAQMGSVSGSGSYNYLSQATIIATAATNYHFEQWSDGSTTNPRLINVTSDSVFVAQFAETPTFTITALSADTARGMVYGGGVYHTGERASLVASPHEHYYFSHWADGSTQNPRTITVLSDATYTAYFAPYTYIITANSNNPAMGGVSGGGAYAYGETATLTARAYEGYHFVRWDDGNANATREVLVQSDESYMAIFAQGNDENGIDEVHYADLKVYSSDGQIVVECSETLPVYVYDIVGRHTYSGTVLAGEPLRINVPNTGVYVVRVGEMKAEKVAVW